MRRSGKLERQRGRILCGFHRAALCFHRAGRPFFRESSVDTDEQGRGRLRGKERVVVEGERREESGDEVRALNVLTAARCAFTRLIYRQCEDH